MYKNLYISKEEQADVRARRMTKKKQFDEEKKPLPKKKEREL